MKEIEKKHCQHTSGGAEAAGEKPVIKELLVKCFDAADNPEDAFLCDFVQGQQWRDDQPEGAHQKNVREEELPAACLVSKGVVSSAKAVTLIILIGEDLQV